MALYTTLPLKERFNTTASSRDMVTVKRTVRRIQIKLFFKAVIIPDPV